MLHTVMVAVILTAFLRPFIEAALVVVGEWWFHAGFRTHHGKYDKLLIQITTVGREQARVTEIIRRIRAYKLPMWHEIWVVIEPGHNEVYPGADRVLVVPAGFTCKAVAKARALEYSRLIRVSEGYAADAKLKLLCLDDDVEPTRAYITTGFAGDYDLCQGVTAPRIHYGNHNLKHFFLSHMDDMRFLACLVWCSFTQGVIKRPVYAHGEGLFVTMRAEQKVTWDYPIFASEDLVFGQNASAKGLSWGWFHEYIELTSPWTAHDFLRQRRRWLWGNIHAVIAKGVLPVWGRVFVVTKYLLGFGTFFASAAGIGLVLTHTVQVSNLMYALCWGAFTSWVFSFAVSGWVNSGRRSEDDHRGSARFFAHRLWQSLMAVLLAVTLITPAWTTLVLLVALVQGNPRGFHVIAKTAETAAALKNGGGTHAKV